MHQLIFHPAWDKAIADQDRKHILQIYRNIRLTEKDPIQITVLRHAFNYKEELLVTGIVHNLTEEMYTPHHETIIYRQDGQDRAKSLFTIPDLIVNGKTSTPWTFIFPKEATIRPPLSSDPGYLWIETKKG